LDGFLVRYFSCDFDRSGEGDMDALERKMPLEHAALDENQMHLFNAFGAN
jgi:hypothetical protein